MAACCIALDMVLTDTGLCAHLLSGYIPNRFASRILPTKIAGKSDCVLVGSVSGGNVRVNGHAGNVIFWEARTLQEHTYPQCGLCCPGTLHIMSSSSRFAMLGRSRNASRSSFEA